MNYVSPVKDTKFILENLLNNPSEIENDLMNSILEEASSSIEFIKSFSISEGLFNKFSKINFVSFTGET